VSLVVASKRRKAPSGRTLVGRVCVAGIVSLSLAAAGPHSVAQPVEPFSDLARATPTGLPAKKLLLEADQLTYDFDNETVTATGDVQIYYEGYVLDAETVTYDQRSGRLMASGGVRLLEPGGNLVSAERLDITDDFRDAFVGSLNVVTTDRARFTAQTAERRDGNLTIFRKGIYTACERCLEHPERPPLWQIKAARIIHELGPRTLVLKRGEYGVLMITPDSVFTAPAYPLENVFDPTGAGDTFAGGFLGYLASCSDLNAANYRRGIIFGSVMASFNVESFSLERLRTLDRKEIDERYRAFRRLTHFEDLDPEAE